MEGTVASGSELLDSAWSLHVEGRAESRLGSVVRTEDFKQTALEARMRLSYSPSEPPGRQRET